MHSHPRRPAWGNLARLRARKEAGGGALGLCAPGVVYAPGLNKGRKISVRVLRPRNICIIDTELAQRENSSLVVLFGHKALFSRLDTNVVNCL